MSSVQLALPWLIRGSLKFFKAIQFDILTRVLRAKITLGPEV
jgi:hypothetical protein